jgi:hypothetical protein
MASLESALAKADLFLLIAELAKAENDSKRVEIAERVVDLDGRWDAAELDDFELIAVAKQIASEQIEKLEKQKRGEEE